MTIEQRSPSPASSPTKLPPSGPLQPIQKAPSPPSPGVPAPALPRHRASGTQRSPKRPPGRASAGKSGASPAPFMAPTLPGGGTVVSGSSRRLRDGTALRRLGGPTCLSHPERRKEETGSVAAEGERNGVRGGTKLPPRVAESAPSGLAPPRGGQRGRAADALRAASAPTPGWCPRGSGPRGPL